MKRLGLLACGAVGLLATGAQAQSWPDVASVQALLRHALPDVTVAQAESRANNTYAISYPIPYLTIAKPGDFRGLVIRTHRGDGGEIVFDGFDLPKPAEFLFAEGAEGQKRPLRFAGISGSGSVDPSFAKATTLTGLYRDVFFGDADPKSHDGFRAELIAPTLNVSAAKDGKVDVDLPVVISKPALTVDGRANEMAADSLTFHASVGGVDTGKAGPMLALLGQMVPHLTKEGDRLVFPPAREQRRIARQWIAEYRNAISSVAYDFSTSGRKGGGMISSLLLSRNHSHMGAGGSSAGGMLTAWFDSAGDGMTRDLGPADFNRLPDLKLRWHFHPVATGIGAEDFWESVRLLLEESPEENRKAEAMFRKAALGHGGVAVTLKDDEAGIGPMTLHVSGTATIKECGKSVPCFMGDWVVTGEGVDALLVMLKAEAGKQPVVDLLPTLTKARAMAKEQGGKLVWAIHWGGDDDGWTVNGVKFAG